MVRAKDMHLEKMTDGMGHGEFIEWLFQDDLFLEAHEEWEEAGLVMQRLRRQEADVTTENYAEVITEAASSGANLGFRKSDWTNYFGKARQLYNLLVPKLNTKCGVMARTL